MRFLSSYITSLHPQSKFAVDCESSIMATPADSRERAATAESNGDEAHDVQLGLLEITNMFTSLAPADRDLFLRLSRQ
jgi:hypothetical protein